MALILDCSNFPFHDRTKAVWYLLIDFKNGNESDYWTVASKNELVNKLKNLIENNQSEYFHLLGIWHGNYYTDAFKLNLHEAYTELSKHFS